MKQYFIYWLAMTAILGSVLGVSSWVICWVDGDSVSFKWALICWYIVIGVVSLLAVVLTAMGIEPRQFKI